MKAYPIFFHDWRGFAIRAEGHWWISPRQVSDHLGLSWRRQRRNIQNSNVSKGAALRASPSAGGEQETLMLKLGYFGAWLLSISPANVPEEKRANLEAMQASLIDALERQLAQMFNLPGSLEPEKLIALPVPGFSGMSTEEVRAAREAVLESPDALQAVRLARLGLPGTKIGAAVQRSAYWARRQRRHWVRIGLVEPSSRETQWTAQLNLFSDASHG